nr:MFS transporter [Pseudomonadota bacterium]
NVHHVSHEQASVVTMMLFVGTIFGSPFVGWLSDRIGLRKPPMVVGAILSIAMMLTLMYSQDLSMGLLILSFLLLGFFTSSQVVSYPVVSESNTTLLTAMSVSCVSLTTIGGGALFEPRFGRLLDMHWSGKIVEGLPVYSIADFRFAMWIFPIGFFIALIATFFIRETHCKNNHV